MNYNTSMEKQSDTMYKIFLLTDFSTGYSRALLEGIMRYAHEVGPWIFYRMPLHFREIYGDEEVIKWAKDWEADGIVAQLDDVNVELFKELNIPIILQNHTKRNKVFPNLTGDYYKTGVMAAEFFIRRGYKNFAYYGSDDIVWIREREEGYRNTITNHGFSLLKFRKQNNNKKEKNEWHYNINALSEWLKLLPKPIALFACDDQHALEITEICKLVNILIPEEIAVLGVDNDNLLCNISNPTLSSIELDVENGGYEAAKLLHQLIEKRIDKAHDIIVDPIKIIKRKSTEQFVIGNKYIKDIILFLEKNYMNNLQVDDLIKIVPLSRRMAEKKFREETGLSIYQYLQNLRIEKLALILQSSKKKLIIASEEVGFRDYKNVARIFQKIKGVTPSEYRKKYTSKTISQRKE